MQKNKYLICYKAVCITDDNTNDLIESDIRESDKFTKKEMIEFDKNKRIQLLEKLPNANIFVRTMAITKLEQ